MAIISTQRLRECQDFIDKVGEIRFNKVKQRQLNKFNLLTIRKEGNITRSNTNLNNHNLNSQTNSQVNQISQASPPSGEDNRSSQAVPPHGEASTSLPPSQANSQAREGGAPPQAGAIPPGEDNSLSQATTSSLSQASPPQAGATPPGEDNSLSQGTTSSFSQASALLPSSEGSRPPNPPGSQAGLASNKNNTLRQGNRCPPRHRPTQTSQEVNTTFQEGNNPTTPPARHPQGSSKEEPNPKWVINLSNKPLTPAQRSVLAKGPNFVVTPRQPPNLEYITAIEAACTKLSQQDAEELRANINRVLRSSHPPKPNLTKAQMSALRELKKDRDCIVLTADKGVAMVVMDRQDYINKTNHLLNQSTYKTINKDPTNTIKNKLINILKTIKTKSGLGTSIYKSMYPTGCVPPKFYGLPKINKPDTPLRPIVSSCGSVTYGVGQRTC